MINAGRFIANFDPATESLSIPGLAIDNKGEIIWKTVEYPVSSIRVIVEQLISLKRKIIDTEDTLMLTKGVHQSLDKFDIDMEGDISNITEKVVQFFTNTDAENMDLVEVPRTAVDLVVKKCFDLLSPVPFLGYFIGEKKDIPVAPLAQQGTNLELPEDVLMEIYPRVAGLAVSSRFEIVSKKFKGKLNKPFSFEKYIDTSPQLVLLEAVKSLLYETDPIIKERLLHIITAAVRAGALLQMNGTFFQSIFACKDDFVVNMLLKEVILKNALYRKEAGMTTNSLLNGHNVVTGIFRCERTDILEKYIKLGVLITIAEYTNNPFNSMFFMTHSDARFIPDNYQNFMESSGLAAFLLADDSGGSMYIPVRDKAFTTRQHPDLLVDAVNKGYIDLNHPIKENHHLSEGFYRPNSSRKDYYQKTIGMYLPEGYMDNLVSSPRLSEVHSPIDEYIASIDPAAREEIFNAANDPEEMNRRGKLVQLENGNYIVACGVARMKTVSLLPNGKYYVRGASKPKEVLELSRKLAEIPTSWVKDAIKDIMRYIKSLRWSEDTLSVFNSILTDCVRLTVKYLFEEPVNERRLKDEVDELYHYFQASPFFRALVISYRDAKYSVDADFRR